jgi:hypothetical protein
LSELFHRLNPAPFLAIAKKSNSADILILQKRKPVLDIRSNKRVHVQPVSKVTLSLAVGLLHRHGKLPSLDITLGEALPRLKGDPKKKITLR